MNDLGKDKFKDGYKWVWFKEGQYLRKMPNKQLRHQAIGLETKQLR